MLTNAVSRGGHLRIAWAEISLKEAEIPTPLIIAMHPPAGELTERVGWLASSDGQAAGFSAPLPSLVSVQRADVAGLVLADIDLRDCHFAGAHHLDQLQLTTADVFYDAPGLVARPSRPSGRGSWCWTDVVESPACHGEVGGEDCSRP